jgi:predicted HicB family RNase H-like nuclease
MNFKTYKFIALFNTLDKTLKSIIVKRISNLMKTHKLLFETQMSKRRERTCETTLKLFTKQIHIVWNMNKNKMTILLNLNVIDAYDHVSKEKLIHNLRKKRISNWIIAWIDNFMQNKYTTLKINKYSTLINLIKIEISQNSFISLVLYLFYNANILKIFERFKYKITIINFVNNINILTYDINITNNCKTLKKTHVIYELWTRRHETRFASIKYELLHLTRNHKRFDMIITINVKNVIKESTTILRVLSVQFDIKLKWDSHVKKIWNKMITQMFALIKLTIFIWKVCFKKIKHVYNAIVRFVITYDSSTWHASHDRFDTSLSLTNKFIDFQKQNLHTINEAFRVTFKEILNVKTRMQFIELHLTYLQTKIRMRLHEDSHNALIIKNCN